MMLGRGHGKRFSAVAFADAERRRPRLRSHSPAGEGAVAPPWRPGSGRRHSVGRFLSRCRWAAARIRSATGVRGPDLGRELISEQRTPWLGLLLWAIACAGLLLSLLTKNDGLDHEPRLAAREIVMIQHSGAGARADLTRGAPRLRSGAEHPPPR
jgi:hypothetical protein